MGFARSQTWAWALKTAERVKAWGDVDFVGNVDEDLL